MKTERAIELAGSAKALAELLGITWSAVLQWGDNVPESRVWQLRVLKPAWFKVKGESSKTKAKAA